MCFIEWWLFSNCYVLLYKCSLLKTDQNRNIVGSVCALVFLGNTHKVFLIWGSLSSLLHALYSLAILFYWCTNRRALYKEFWWNKHQAFKIWALVFFNGVDVHVLLANIILPLISLHYFMIDKPHQALDTQWRL